jgi:predicted N-acetyltransferase YhbS
METLTMAATFLVENTLPSDELLIENLLDVSFGIGRRTKTSYRLREGSKPADGLSLVVRDAEFGIAGSISYWPLAIGQHGTEALLLGPLVVNTRRQNLGVGLALMQEGLLRARQAGFGLTLLVGDEPYYARVGFRKVPAGQLLMPGPVNPDRLLYLELIEGALAEARGLVLPPHRHAELSAAFAGPHKACGSEQGS